MKKKNRAQRLQAYRWHRQTAIHSLKERRTGSYDNNQPYRPPFHRASGMTDGITSESRMKIWITKKSSRAITNPKTKRRISLMTPFVTLGTTLVICSAVVIKDGRQAQNFAQRVHTSIYLTSRDLHSSPPPKEKLFSENGKCIFITLLGNLFNWIKYLKI